MPAWLKRTVPFVTLTAITLAIFARGIFGEFLTFDDSTHIVNNAWLQQGDLSEFWLHPYYGLYIPAVYSVWTLVHQMCPEPWAFHTLNMALHAVNSGLVYSLARRFLKNSAVALLAAIFFCVHPLQVESVAWISSARDLLMATFGLTALVLVSRSEEWLSLTLATLLFGLGALAKPAVVTLGWSTQCLKPTPPKFRIAALWTALAVPLVGLNFNTQRPWIEAHEFALSGWQRLLVAGDSLCFALGKVMFPVGLSADYARTTDGVLNSSWSLSSLVLSGALIAAVVFCRRQRWAQALGFSLLTLLPVLGLAPFLAQLQSTVSDRYLYLPLVGFALIFGLGAELGGRQWLWVWTVPLTLLAGLSFQRVDVWHSNRLLFTDMLRDDRPSYVGASNLGVIELNEKNYAEAERLFRRAIAIHPLVATAHADLAHVLSLTGQYEPLLREEAPLLENESFLAYNRSDPVAVSIFALVVGRAWAQRQMTTQATAPLCLALRLSREDPTHAEAGRLLEQINGKCTH